MSIERDMKYGLCEWECDSCGKTVERDGVRDHESFNAAWEDVRQTGWRTWRAGSTWYHKCEECAPKVTPHRFYEKPDA